MKILFCASEAYPFAKSGGLADVASALPKALAKHEEVTLVLPWYRFMKLSDEPDLLWEGELRFGGSSYLFSFWKTSYEGVEVILVNSPLLFERDALYGEEQAYEDNDLRFTIFSRAIVAFAKRKEVDVLHLNDWHTALAALFAKEEKLSCKVVFTIHNLAFQGIFEKERLGVLGLDRGYFHIEALEFYEKINFLKAGIAFSDVVTTVSPTYAKEIQTPEFGCGLDGFLKKHSYKIKGILNGIDTQHFDPRRDPMIAIPLKRKITTYKRGNKKAFWKKKSALPLFIFVGRLTEQKGVDLLLILEEKLAKLPLLLAILGEGEAKVIDALHKIAKKQTNIRYFEGYDEVLAHQMYAAADFLLMPSRFEPCGLSQMIAMHYGTIPIVHKIGGLSDTVHSRGNKCGQGIVYYKNSAKSLQNAIQKALKLYEDKEKLEAINSFNISCDFSFEMSAVKYLQLYRI